MRGHACLLFLVLVLSPLPAVEPAAVDLIDPLVGTGHFGKTFPGPALPGGMVQLSPDTITGGDNGSGYRHDHTTIQGFSLTHLSGVGWYGDLGNLLVMPTTGPLRTHYGITGKPGSGYLSSFRPESVVAQAGYYAVTLEDYRTRAEVTATARCGLLRFTLPADPTARIQIDLARRIGGTSLQQEVRFEDDRTLEGSVVCTPEGGGWGHGQGMPNYTVHFRAEFSATPAAVGMWSATLPPGPYRTILGRPDFEAACAQAEDLPGCRERRGAHLGVYATFPAAQEHVVQVRIGISFVSVAGARANLATELPDWDFDRVRAAARQAWAAELQRVEVDGGTRAQRTAFVTALYHALLDPRIIADVTGDYPGGDGRPHRAKDFTRRSIFSGWDVYRSQFPLLTLIAPDTVRDLIASLVHLADENGTGTFDRWEFLNAYSGVMTGHPAVVVLADAYGKGIRGYDVGRAYAIARTTCATQGAPDPGNLSKTLENGIADAALARLAQQLGKADDAALFGQRAQSYRTLFDPQQAWTYDAAGTDAHPGWQGCFRLRDAKGSWLPWAGLTSHRGCLEGNVLQYSFMAPHDIPGLIALHGGPAVFTAKLSEFFDRTPPVTAWSGPGRKGKNEIGTEYYNHPNEPCHLTPFLFNRAGAPWLAQRWVRTIDGAYTTGSEGLCGDDDVGQMSAWFVLASAGLHPADPTDGRYEIVTPLFDRITLRIPGATAFTVTARNNSPVNVYIQSARLNGAPLQRCWLTYQEIAAGGTLDLDLGAEPNRAWGLGD